MSAESRNDFRCAVIVAHPDDEIIWCGGLIRRHPEWNWTVLSLCRGDDGDRAPRFLRACQAIGASGVICNLDDSSPPIEIRPRQDIGRHVAEHLGGVPWDLCLTHGMNGEYGHPRHVQVHSAVLSMRADGLLECAQLWTFAYDCLPVSGRCLPAGGADVLLKLTRRELTEKKRLIREVYGFRPRSFEDRACISPEAFVKQSIQQETLP